MDLELHCDDFVFSLFILAVHITLWFGLGLLKKYEDNYFREQFISNRA